MARHVVEALFLYLAGRRRKPFTHSNGHPMEHLLRAIGVK